MKAVLLAKSSTGEPYKVEFLSDESSVRIFCHCQAGVLQQMCKHKLALIKGDEKMLIDPNQSALLSEIQAWPQFVTLKTHACEYETKTEGNRICKSCNSTKRKGHQNRVRPWFDLRLQEINRHLNFILRTKVPEYLCQFIFRQFHDDNSWGVHSRLVRD
ncbi:MAG: hypothetical protein ABI042_19845 [Verrucomicrobiota bacterium]